jgi:hypothetical protein
MHRTQLIEKKKKKEKKTKEISFFSSFLFLPQSESEAASHCNITTIARCLAISAAQARPAKSSPPATG